MPEKIDEPVRAQMNAAIQAYLVRLPEPRELPEKIEVTIRYKEGVERHEIPLGTKNDNKRKSLCEAGGAEAAEAACTFGD